MSIADRIADLAIQTAQAQGQGAQNIAAIQARALEQAAQARAEAQARNGALWGQTIANIGQQISSIPAQIQQGKTVALENQTRQLQNTRLQQLQAGEQASQQLWQNLPKTADGLFDTATLAQNPNLAKMTAEQRGEFLNQIDGFNKVQASFNQQRQAHAADLADQALTAAKKSGEPLTPFTAAIWMNTAAQSGIATPAEVNQVKQALASGADPTTVFQTIRGMSEKYKPKQPIKLGPGDTLVNPDNPTAALFTAPPEPGKGQHVINGQLVGPDGKPIGQAIPPQQSPNEAETIRHNQAMEAISRMNAGREAAQAAETARHNKATEAANNPLAALQGQPATGANGAPTNPTGQAVLDSVPPQIASQVKALAEGRMQFPSGFALKSPYWQSMLSLVSQYDPSFDAVNYNARANTRKDFTSGKSAQQVNALNTVVGHLSELSDKADALGNGSTPFVNSVKNWISRQGGSQKVTNFETAKQAVADELTRVYRQAGGSEQDIKSWEQSLNAANSPEQLHGAFATISDLLESKLNALQNQYSQGMGTNAVQMITPQARQALDKLAGKSAPATKGRVVYDINGNVVSDGR